MTGKSCTIDRDWRIWATNLSNLEYPPTSVLEQIVELMRALTWKIALVFGLSAALADWAAAQS